MKENQPASKEEAAGESANSWWTPLVIVTGLVVVLGLLRKHLSIRIRAWLAWSPMVRWQARRTLRKACRNNDALQAHRALLAWYRQQGVSVPIDDDLRTQSRALYEQWVKLVACLFGASGADDWNGSELWETFTQLDQTHGMPRDDSQELPSLNPTVRGRHLNLRSGIPVEPGSGC